MSKRSTKQRRAARRRAEWQAYRAIVNGGVLTMTYTQAGDVSAIVLSACLTRETVKP